MCNVFVDDMDVLIFMVDHLWNMLLPSAVNASQVEYLVCTVSCPCSNKITNLSTLETQARLMYGLSTVIFPSDSCDFFAASMIKTG